MTIVQHDFEKLICRDRLHVAVLEEAMVWYDMLLLLSLTARFTDTTDQCLQ